MIQVPGDRCSSAVENRRRDFSWANGKGGLNHQLKKQSDRGVQGENKVAKCLKKDSGKKTN